MNESSYNMKADVFFSADFRARFGRLILYIAIASFLIHLLFYFAANYLFQWHPQGLLTNPINAIYTPFSFLLVYEAYLLLYYLQQSTTFYIGKQYEIITLILIRGIFKDITHLHFSGESMLPEHHNELWYDLGTVLLVFLLIFLFYRESTRFKAQSGISETSNATPVQVQRFIRSKKTLAVFLLIVSVLLGAYSFIDWLMHFSADASIRATIDINAIFFDHFFTLLIMSDVVILLLSLFYTDDFPLIIRNSSFVVSTILLKLSFAASGIMAQVFIIVGVSFGVAMYAIANLYTKDKMKTAVKT